MKKLLLFVAFSIFATIFTHAADDSISVKLNDKQPSQLIELEDNLCRFIVTKTDVDDDNAKVTVEIENLDDEYIIGLFRRAFTEESLKKQKITFDKKFQGTKGCRSVEAYPEGNFDEIFIGSAENDGKYQLPDIFVKSGEPKLCRFPLYIAEYKKFYGANSKKNKIVLIGCKIVDLEIEVDVKPDEDFIRLDSASNKLIDDIRKQVFCTNPKHKPSLEQQEASYKERLKGLISEVDSICYGHYQEGKYDGILQKLKDIDFSEFERDCENSKNHRVAVSRRHSCKYCKLSLQTICNKLDDYYKKIYNRKITKDEAMADVEALYNCAKQSSSWNKSEYKSNIEKFYKRICNS